MAMRTKTKELLERVASWPDEDIARVRPAQARPSRNDIGRELVLDKGDAVAQIQLALFQALDLQLVGARGIVQRLDRGVEVTMLLPQARQLRPELAFFLIRHCCRYD